MAGRAEQAQSYHSIQALRGAAAALVVLFHAGLHEAPGAALFRTGNAGVDIFFVISGFVMATVTARRPVPPLLFLRQRAVRLVPMYWITTALLLALWAASPGMLPHMHPTLGHALLSFGFVPHVSPDTGAVTPVLGQGWTLNFEMMFYGLFALALSVPARLRFAAAAVPLLALPVLGLFVITPSSPVTSLLSPLLAEFLGGLVLGRLALAPWRPARAWCWLGLAVGAGLLALAAPADGDEWARALVYGVPAVLIVGSAVALEGRGLRVPGWLREAGDASYATYLTHGFVIALLGKLWPASLPPWLFMAAAAVLAALAGSVVWRVLERPLQALLRPLAARAAPALPRAAPGLG